MILEVLGVIGEGEIPPTGVSRGKYELRRGVGVRDIILLLLEFSMLAESLKVYEVAILS